MPHTSMQICRGVLVITAKMWAKLTLQVNEKAVAHSDNGILLSTNNIELAENDGSHLSSQH